MIGDTIGAEFDRLSKELDREAMEEAAIHELTESVAKYIALVLLIFLFLFIASVVVCVCQIIGIPARRIRRYYRRWRRIRRERDEPIESRLPESRLLRRRK